MKIENIKVRIIDDPCRFGYSIFLYDKSDTEDVKIINPQTLETTPYGKEEIPDEYKLHFEYEILEKIINECQKKGIGSKIDRIKEEKLLAKEEHLKDLRELIFNNKD